MKNADYVYKTVKAYRLLADSTADNFKESLLKAQEILQYDYARTKTTCNFINKNENIFEPEKSKNLGLYMGKIENKTASSFCLNYSNKVVVGDVLRIVDLKKDKSVVLTVTEVDKNKISYENLYIENGFEVYKIADGNHWRYGGIEDWRDGNDKSNDNGKKCKVFLRDKGMETLRNRNDNGGKILLPNLFIRINNLKWLKLLKNKTAIVIKLNKNNIADIKSLKDIKDFYIELPAYIDEEGLKLFQQNIDFIINKGCTKFFINNISHFEFFNNKKVELFAGQFLYTLNTYSAQFLYTQQINSFCVSWEDDIYNIKNLSKYLKNRLIVYLVGFPEIVTSKMNFLDEVENKNIKSNKDEFTVISNNNENIIIPKFPINLLSFKKSLINIGIKSFGIDLCYIESNINYLNQILNAFNNNLFSCFVISDVQR